jgi:uncharacterized membrane protein YciS (DUF1049 family)
MVYGFVAGIIMVALSVLLYVTGLSFKYEWMSYVVQIPFLVCIILNAQAYSKANDGYVTFGNVFGSCFKMSMIVAIVMVGWMIAAIYIFPEMKDKAIELARTKMAEKSPNASDEYIETSIGVVSKYWNYIMVGSAIFGSLFFGAIFSLIGAATAKKNGPRPGGDNF